MMRHWIRKATWTWSVQMQRYAKCLVIAFCHVSCVKKENKSVTRFIHKINRIGVWNCARVDSRGCLALWFRLRDPIEFPSSSSLPQWRTRLLDRTHHPTHTHPHYTYLKITFRIGAWLSMMNWRVCTCTCVAGEQ